MRPAGRQHLGPRCLTSFTEGEPPGTQGGDTLRIPPIDAGGMVIDRTHELLSSRTVVDPRIFEQLIRINPRHMQRPGNNIS